MLLLASMHYRQTHMNQCNNSIVLFSMTHILQCLIDAFGKTICLHIKVQHMSYNTRIKHVYVVHQFKGKHRNDKML